MLFSFLRGAGEGARTDRVCSVTTFYDCRYEYAMFSYTVRFVLVEPCRSPGAVESLIIVLVIAKGLTSLRRRVVVERVGVGGGVPLMIIRDERVGVPERVVFDVIVVASNPQSANIDHWYAVMSAVALARAARASLRGRGVAAVYL